MCCCCCYCCCYFVPYMLIGLNVLIHQHVIRHDKRSPPHNNVWESSERHLCLQSVPLFKKKIQTNKPRPPCSVLGWPGIPMKYPLEGINMAWIDKQIIDEGVARKRFQVMKTWRTRVPIWTCLIRVIWPKIIPELEMLRMTSKVHDLAFNPYYVVLHLG